MKPRRIFVAINLPDSVKNELLAYREKWPELPARWTPKENLHLTLAFLGNTSDQELLEICALMEEAAKRHESFSIKFTKIMYGPSRQVPRMIWAIGEESPELLALQKDVAIRQDPKPFSPHLTLARLKMFELQRMETEELPEVNEEISLAFEVSSIEVMESKLKRSGAEYIVIQSFMLQK